MVSENSVVTFEVKVRPNPEVSKLVNLLASKVAACFGNYKCLRSGGDHILVSGETGIVDEKLIVRRVLMELFECLESAICEQFAESSEISVVENETVCK